MRFALCASMNAPMMHYEVLIESVSNDFIAQDVFREF